MNNDERAIAMDDFYAQLRNAISDALAESGGHYPLICGDFNVNILEGHELGRTLKLYGRAVGRSQLRKGKNSAHTTQLLEFVTREGLSVLNTCIRTVGRAVAPTWVHPPTKTPHLKDLIVGPLRSRSYRGMKIPGIADEVTKILVLTAWIPTDHKMILLRTRWGAQTTQSCYVQRTGKTGPGAKTRSSNASDVLAAKLSKKDVRQGNPRDGLPPKHSCKRLF